jgi:DNA primase small subunit
MELDDEGRKAIVGWLEVIKGGKEMGKKVNVRLGASKNGPGVLPPSLQTALDPLATLFSSLILMDQNCFSSEEGYEALLQLVPDRGVADNLRKKWEADPDRHSADKWGDLKSEVKRFDRGSPTRVRSLNSSHHYPLTPSSFAGSIDSSPRRHNSPIYLPANRRRSLETP